MPAPVVLFVYNRPLHTQQTIENLLTNKECCDTVLYVFSDGAKQNNDIEAVNKVRAVTNSISGFKEVILFERNNNFGLAKSIINGLSDLFTKHPALIVLEDDIIVSDSFLHYMNHCLSFYRDSSAFSISAYQPPISIPDNYPYSTYLVPRTNSWGWATWKEKWALVDWDVPDFKSFIFDKNQQQELEKGGNDTTPMLLKQQKGLISSWAIRFNYACYKANGLCVYPTKSLTKNIGVDGSGTHMRSSSKYKVTLAQSVDKNQFCPPNHEDKLLQERFKRFFNTSIQRLIINYFKTLIYKAKINKEL